ncbi:MAG: hypothetical protein QM504_03165 [Pseudomonadota bacterium]
MKILKSFQKVLSFILCITMMSFSIPVFANVSDANEVVKIELTSSDMNVMYGANGSVDVSLADYAVAGSKATAVFANRSTIGVKYSLDVVNSNGVVLENLAMGNLGSDTAILISGTPTLAAPNNKYVQARVWSESLLGLESKDTSWAP